MFDMRNFRTMVFNNTDTTLALEYAKNVVDIVVCGKSKPLFDFSRMPTSDGRTIAELLAVTGMSAFQEAVTQANSDVSNVNAGALQWMVLGALQNLCLGYSNDSNGDIVRDLYCGNPSVYRMMVFNKTVSNVESVADKLAKTALNRMVVPKAKKFGDAKARNLYGDLLIGVEGRSQYCGPRFSITGSNKTQFTMETKNCNGVDITQTLFVPVSFIFIISDVFNLIMTGGSTDNFCPIELMLMKEVSKYIQGILGDKKFHALKMFSVVDKSTLVSELATCSKSLENWSSRRKNKNVRGITLSADIIHRIYGKIEKGRGKKGKDAFVSTIESRNKVESGAGVLGVSLPDLNIGFYDTRSEATSVELQVFNPLNFYGILQYKSSDIETARQHIADSKKFPRIVMLSVYLDYIDNIFATKPSGVDRLWELTGVPEELLGDLYSDDHYGFMVNSSKRYSATDIYEIITDPNLALIFYKFNENCIERQQQMGISDELKAVNLPEITIDLSSAEETERRLRRREILKDALSKYVCVVEYKPIKSPRVSRYYVTYNMDIVKRLYGEDFIAKYGSLRYKLQTLQRGMETATTVEQITEVINKTVFDILNKPVDIGKGKIITCPSILPSADFTAYAASVDTFLQNMKLEMGLTSFDEADKSDTTPIEKKPLCSVNAAAPKRYNTGKKQASDTFNTWIYERGVQKLFYYKPLN